MGIEELYNKTVQMWNLTKSCRDELSESLMHKTLRHKATGVRGDFYDVDLTYTSNFAVRIIIMDEHGGKYRGNLTDFEIL